MDTLGLQAAALTTPVEPQLLAAVGAVTFSAKRD
jgi:hypothetical protein